MIAIKIKSNGTLIINVIKKLKKVDFERISLYIESLIENDSQSNILFSIESKNKDSARREIEKYCEQLPYNYQIN